MDKPLKHFFIPGLIYAGFLALILNGALANPLLMVSLAGFAVLSWRFWRCGDKIMATMLPFASGLLSFFLKFFYWDRFDLNARIDNLVLISLVFSLFLLGRELRWVPRMMRSFNRLSLKKRVISLFVLFEVIFVAASYTVAIKKEVVLVGDEPHYLALAQSVIRDGDLNVFNQYYRDGYREFIEVDRLKAHAAFGRGYKKMYSYHLPGISITISPFLAGKISLPLLYFLVRSYLGLFGSLLMVMIYLFSLKLWRHRSLALYVTLALGLSAPIFFHAFHIFPEVQALLLIVSSLYLLLYGSDRPRTYVLSGLLLAVTIFWGLKYAIFIYLFCAGTFFYLIFKRRGKQALLFILFPLLFQLLFFYYLHFAYGSFSPQSIYRGMMSAAASRELYQSLLSQIPLGLRIETLLDYFLDQRDGLLLYSPLYIFALPGLILALRRFKLYSKHIWISLPALAYILYHAMSTVRAGFCPQARYLVPVMWFLMLFTIVYFRETKNRRLKRVMLSLPLYSFFVTLYQVFNPFTLYQPTTHDSLFRPGLLFQQWSNTVISLPDYLPSFIKIKGNAQYLPNILFLLAIALFTGYALRRVHKTRQFPVWPLVFFISFSLFVLFPRVRLYNPVVVQRPGVLPHRIHGASHYPSQAASWLFHMKRGGAHAVTISTPRKSPSMQVRLLNRGSADIRYQVYLFDQVVKQGRLIAGENLDFTVNKPIFKRAKGSFYYRFHVCILNGGSGKIRLEGEWYPVSNGGRQGD